MSRDYARIAEEYVQGVISGAIPACRQVIQACERHSDDLSRDDFSYVYEPEKGARACKFVELQYHTKGKWAKLSERIVLEPWQCFLIMSIFGWVHSDKGTRRFWRALLLVPRKNGKSALAAAIGLYMMVADGEYGAEVYSGATTEKQSWEVFRPARLMALKNEPMKSHYGIGVGAKNIHVIETGARFEPIVGNPGDGASPSCAITDEYHEHQTDALLDTMETGMGAREQPLSLIVTTAGDNISGPCYMLQKSAERILAGQVKDDGFFALIYGIDPDDDWTDPATLRKANPNFGVSVFEDFLIGRQQEAIRDARRQGTFKTKHLNVWVGARDAYFNLQSWHKCLDKKLKLEDFKGQECVIGLDLASKVDIAAMEIVFRTGHNRYARFGRYYLPEATVMDESNEHYRAWQREGLLTVTDGDIIDFDYIHEDIMDLCSQFQVREIAYDPHQATMLVTSLMNDGVPCVEVRPTVLNFSEPMKTLDGYIRARQMAHDGDPIFAWMLSNVTAKEDRKDNVYPTKDRPENKIDGVVAHLMALARWIVPGEQFIVSPWDTDESFSISQDE